MNLLKEVTENKFLLVMLSEEQYASQLHKIVESLEKTKEKVCYVCLSKPYTDVLADLKKNRIDTKEFVFIDVLSSHYGKPAPKKNCIFLDSPDLNSIKGAIGQAMEKKKCSVLLFDTISSMLIYQESFPILKFTQNLTAEKRQESVKKVFIVLKKSEGVERENAALISDLKMFADKTLELG